ncbi:MAG: MATE family efflux transporter [Caldisericota bacterium]|nr:MATE family efflux transporter [Caldisericota bacterium]
MKKLYNMMRRKPDPLNGLIVEELFILGLPVILANFAQTLYNIVDAFWLGKVGKAALTAPTITFNVVFIFIAFSMGISVGGSTLVAQYTGARRSKQAEKTAGTTIFLMIILGITSGIIGFLFAPSVLRLLHTPSDAFASTLTYMRIIFLGMPFMFVYHAFQGVIQGKGNTITPMKIVFVSIVINIILDPIMIFGIGMPKMGVMGAAIATDISRVIAAYIGLRYLFSKKSEIPLKIKDISFNKKLAKKIFHIGLPLSFGQMATSIGFTVLISIVNIFGSAVISAFGIGNRMISLLNMPAMGFSHAATVMVGQNMGAGNVERAENIVWKTVIIIAAFLFSGATLTFLFGGGIVRFFINDPEVISIGINFFRIASYSVPFFGIMFAFNAAFSGSGHTFPILVLNTARLWAIRIPLAYLWAIKMEMGPNGIFYSMVISNIVISLLAFIWFKTGTWKKKIITKKEVLSLETEPKDMDVH